MLYNYRGKIHVLYIIRLNYRQAYFTIYYQNLLK